jgi:tripartite-type tricarboxylate transporter receptor subunit TctC
MPQLKRLILFAVASLSLISVQSLAQTNYPIRPVRLVVGFAAGSSGDVAARIISQKLSEIMGRAMIVENRPGASGMVAAEYAARASTKVRTSRKTLRQ